MTVETNAFIEDNLRQRDLTLGFLLVVLVDAGLLYVGLLRGYPLDLGPTQC